MFNKHNFNQKAPPKANFAFKNNNLNNLFNNQGSSVFYPELNKNDEYFAPPKKTANINNKAKEEIIKDESTQAYMIIEEYLDSEGISRNHVFDKIVDYIYRNELAKNNFDDSKLNGEIKKFVNSYFVINNINHDYFINSIKEMITNPSVIGQKITYNWERLKGCEASMITKLSHTVYKSYQSFQTNKPYQSFHATSPIQTSTPIISPTITTQSPSSPLYTSYQQPQPYTPPSVDVHSLFKNILNSNWENKNEKNKEIQKNSNNDLESRITKLENIINDLTNEINELKRNQSRTYELERQLNDISSIVNQTSIYSDEDDETSQRDNDYDDLPPLIDDSKPCINVNQLDCNCQCEDTISNIESDIEESDNESRTNDTSNQEFDLNKFMNNAEKIGKTIAIEFIKSFKLPFNNQ
jgi:hypothetical protein